MTNRWFKAMPQNDLNYLFILLISNITVEMSGGGTPSRSIEWLGI